MTTTPIGKYSSKILINENNYKSYNCISNIKLMIYGDY